MSTASPRSQSGIVPRSLLSTPIVNPPQCGILEMHAIQECPVASDGTVDIRPMMYVALTCHHRVVIAVRP